jgi:hypothetical protein
MENANAIQTMTEWRVREQYVPMIALGVGCALLKRRLLPRLEPHTIFHGTLKSMLDASAILDTVVPTVLGRNVLPELMSWEETETKRGVNALGVDSVITAKVFVSATQVTWALGVRSKLFMVKARGDGVV